MVLIKYIGVFLLGYLLLYFLVPKGIPLHEFVKLPVWVFKMETFPRIDLEKIKYKYGDHFRQYLNYYPALKGSPEKQHVVVYFHGGGWQFGRPGMFRPNAQILIERGYHVFMPSHRRIPFFNILKQREDAARAIKKVREIMEAEGIADKKILLGGMSSGSNLAGLLAFDGSLLASVGLSNHELGGIFLLGPPINLGGMWHSPPLWILAGSRSSERFRLANPIEHLEENDPRQILLLHPDKDGLVEYKSVQAFYEKTQELGFENVEFHTLENMTHLDAASWCFDNHPSKQIVIGWMEKVENTA